MLMLNAMFRVFSVTFLPIAWASNSFTYNGDSECTYPISSFEITSIRCLGASGVYVEGYNDYNNDKSYKDDSTCSFGDTMAVVGTATLDATTPKKFSVTMRTCYGGSDSTVTSYSPKTCKTYRTTLDLNDYAKLSEAEFYDQEVDESEYYMTAGTYKWYAGFTIPSKGFYFATGSTVDVYLTLYPSEPYADYPYNNNYAWGVMTYNAKLYDSKYETNCFASFDAVADEEKTGYSKYYYRGAAGILLLGMATFVTMKRKVICSCDNRQVGDEGHYKATEDDTASIHAESQFQ